MPFDFDILAPSRVIMPWVKRLAKGSDTPRWPMSVRAFAKNLA